MDQSSAKPDKYYEQLFQGQHMYMLKIGFHH